MSLKGVGEGVGVGAAEAAGDGEVAGAGDFIGAGVGEGTCASARAPENASIAPAKAADTK